MNDADRQSLARLLSGLQQSLQALFDQRQQAAGRRRQALLRKLLLGLELRWKLEEQLLLPALREAEPALSSDVDGTTRELELMRDLAMLVAQTAPANREVTLAVLEGMATLHATRVATLLERPPADAADWAQLETGMRELLDRWQHELQDEGEIEDEDRDPVGLAPR